MVYQCFRKVFQQHFHNLQVLFFLELQNITMNMPQPLYNTIIGVKANFPVSYLSLVILRAKSKQFIVSYIGTLIFNDLLGSSTGLHLNQNCVIMKCVIERFRCIIKLMLSCPLND